MAEFDYKEYARQMRENAVKDSDGVIRCSPELWEQIANIIENTPTANVAEVKRGKWIKVGKTRCNSNILKCSVCSTVRQGVAYTKYCRDCGAKMDK